ncbi:MAG: hypothetical protein GTO13_18920 [Proteobacteria bacterium]|nr:hypothetical protein [Pseudomonadota bacterium]
MGEIKSTWDIVMEKTKGLKVTSRDRERIKREELISKANAIFHRYIDAQGNQAYLQRELEAVQGEEKEVIKRELLCLLLDSIDLSTDNGKVITGIDILKGKPAAKIMKRLRLLASQFKVSRDKRAREVEGIFLRRLAAMGISGSAVQPSLEGKMDWIEALEGLQSEYGDRLEALKEELLNS